MIQRTFMCGECGYRLEQELRSDQWEQGPPDCPACSVERMDQEFHPPAIGGSIIGKATDLAHEIASTDYGVSDIKSPSRSGRQYPLKDMGAEVIPPSTWAAAGSQLQQAIAIGRETRIKHGNGLDILQGALKSGAQRDLIADSKAKSYKVW